MKNRKSLLWVMAVVVLAGAAIVALPRLNDSTQAKQAPTLQGRYAFFTAGGSPVEAALGSLVADGNGNLTASSITLNIPTAAIAPGVTGRTSLQIAVTGGTYTVNANGPGEASATIQIPGMAPSPRSYDLLVTEVSDGVVTEAYLAQRQFTTGVTVFPNALGYYRLKRLSD